MSRSPELAFVAYSSRDQAVTDVILEGVRRANALPTPVRFEPWVFNDVPGNPLVSPILAKIDESPFVVADITYINLNVVYEIGFAIGRSKRAFLIRHAPTPGDKALTKEAGIFDTLGYHEYEAFEDLKGRLTSHIDPTPLPFSSTLDRKAPVYVIEPPTRTTAATLMVSRLKKAGYRYRSFNPSEDARLSASDAIRQVACSSGILVLLQEASVDGSVVQNVRTLFVAGLAHGMGKPSLLLSPAGYDAPLDVRDAVKVFRHPDDLRLTASVEFIVTDPGRPFRSPGHDRQPEADARSRPGEPHRPLWTEDEVEAAQGAAFGGAHDRWGELLEISG